MAPTTANRAQPSARPPGPAARHPRLVSREGLLAALDRAAAGRVTVIAAPAGSGKTSLLRAWADRPGRRYRIAMVHVERDQQDAQLFWLALLGAVRRLAAVGGAEVPAATPDFSGPAMVDRVLEELARLAEHGDTGHSDTEHGDVMLVIDDAHELAPPQAFSQLARLLANLPAGVHAILATRRDLPLRLHRLRLAGELAELRAADLRFTEDETRELLAASGIKLSQTSTTLLHQRTEGWAAGLRLAAIALADHPDPDRFVAEFSGNSRTVSEYLIAEMLDRQTCDVVQLLLRTSILERVNGELADLLTGSPGSDRILLDLEEANAFVVSLDAERTWFRYHRLFADLLRLELRRKLPDEVHMLHRRAAGWFVRDGRIIDAIRHLQAAGDWADAAELLTGHAFGMMLDGQEETMQALLQAFPQQAGANDPKLSPVRAMVDLVHGHLDEAAAQLAVADGYLESAGAQHKHRLGVAVASLKLSLARRRGDLSDVARQADFLDSPLSGESGEDIALGSDLRAMALMNLGIVEAWTRRFHHAERHLREGVALAREIGRPYLEVGCLAQLGFASQLLSFAAARRHCEEAVALAERHGWGSAPIVAPALVTLAGTLAWTGEFDEAERWRERAEQALRSDAGPGIRTLLHLVGGMLRAGRGRHDRAFEEFCAAEALQAQLAGPHALTPLVIGWTLATRARLGMADQARAAFAALDDGLAGSGEVRDALAVTLLAQGDPDAAVAALAEVVDGRAPVLHTFTVVEAHLLKALAHRDLGDRRAANDEVELALALAEPDRLVLPFAMTGAADLLDAVPRRESAHAALLTDILDVVRGSAPAAGERPAAPARELSPTELRVLRYLLTNLSRQEIAGELSVSVNTVNTHLRNIYAKLQATDRSSAVRRARELRLLSGGR